MFMALNAGNTKVYFNFLVPQVFICICICSYSICISLVYIDRNIAFVLLCVTL